MRLAPRIGAAVVIVAVFVAGVFTGLTLERWHGGGHSGSTDTATGDHVAALEQMRDALELSDEQMEGIHAILAEHQDVVHRMWEQFRPSVQSTMREVHEEIQELLTPQQRARFHEWLTEHFDAAERHGMGH